jgi:hypothetical protein
MNGDGTDVLLAEDSESATVANPAATGLFRVVAGVPTRESRSAADRRYLPTDAESVR